MLVIGWREWVSLPLFCKTKIKVKIDTGARTSCLHAFNVQEIRKGRKKFIRFDIHPLQKSKRLSKTVTAELIEYRSIKSSNGQTSIRPVVETDLVIGNKSIKIELTLTDRDQMGFRMLLGREALRKNFLIDPSKSFLQSKA